MTMTKHDFDRIAAAFAVRMRAAKSVDERLGLSNIAWDIADVCAASNPRFDRARFLVACGVQSAPKEES